MVGKLIQYKGKEAHAGGAPHLGINALNAAEIGLTRCQPEQIVYVSFSGDDQAEIYTQQRTSVFGEILDAMQQSILGLIEYLHPTAA